MATAKLMTNERYISHPAGFFSSSDKATSAENIRHLDSDNHHSNKVIVPRDKHPP